MRFKRLLQIIGLLIVLVVSNIQFSYAGDASQLVMTDMQGNTHTLAQYKGKWLVVNYWATWCPPCVEEMPELVAFYDARKNQDVMVLGIALDIESPESVANFVDDMLVSYPIILGTEHIENTIGRGDLLPTTFIYNPNGKLVKTKRGTVTRLYLESLIKQLSIKH